jgi:hypothetical protein
MIDTVALSLCKVKEQLDEAGVNYKIEITRPTRQVSNLEEDSFYIIRQRVHSDGVYHLLAAAKMGKERL